MLSTQESLENNENYIVINTDLKSSTNKDTAICCSYQYNLKRRNLNSCIWICQTSKCNATITSNDQKVVTKANGVCLKKESDMDKSRLPVEIWYDEICITPNHGQTSQSVFDAKITMQTIKSRVVNEHVPIQGLVNYNDTSFGYFLLILKIFLAIYQDEQSKFIKNSAGKLDLNEISKVFPQFSSKQASLYRHRLTILPKLPASIDDIKMENEWTKTDNGEDFLVSHKRTDKFCTISFCSQNGLKILAASKRWQVDGTIETAPALFYQFYIIHGWYKGNQTFPEFFLI